MHYENVVFILFWCKQKKCKQKLRWNFLFGIQSCVDTLWTEIKPNFADSFNSTSRSNRDYNGCKPVACLLQAVLRSHLFVAQCLQMKRKLASGRVYSTCSFRLNVRLHPAIATNPVQFVGQNDCSLPTIWYRNRSKQLANDLFSQRSCIEDAVISNNCLHLPDRSLILPYSGKNLFNMLYAIYFQANCKSYSNDWPSFEGNKNAA
jgi:hypothetical protein